MCDVEVRAIVIFLPIMTLLPALLAFETLYSRLFVVPPRVLTADSSIARAPLFVTWKKHDDLRGCIGTFQDLEVDEGVRRFALTSAFEDPRFPAITQNEITSLAVSVTLLADFTPIASPLDWTIGDHGLRLAFYLNGKNYSGTFLPSVAEEENWDQLTTLRQLLRKAGYTRPRDVEAFYEAGLKDKWMSLDRYTGIKSELTYPEFELAVEQYQE